MKTCQIEAATAMNPIIIHSVCARGFLYLYVTGFFAGGFHETCGPEG